MTALAPAPTRTWRRTAPWVAAGVLFVAYPVLRPWGDADPATAGAAFGSPLWLAAHLSAAAAFVLVGYGLLATRDRPGTVLGLWWAGASLTLLYYGAETFALHALGAAVPDGAALAALAEGIRMGPVQLTVFGAGLGPPRWCWRCGCTRWRCRSRRGWCCSCRSSSPGRSCASPTGCCWAPGAS
jgi:hypothetical protein